MVQAVDHINFSIPRGKTLALVGESGCGKTTTAKLVLRLERPTTGQVTLENADVHNLEVMTSSSTTQTCRRSSRTLGAH